MLNKLIKYEFAASGRILLPLYGAMIAFGFISALFYRLPQEMLDSEKPLGIATIIMIIIYGALIVSSFVLSYVIAIYRFKKNLFDCEGYLMNTLPVTAGQNIAAKAIVAVVYQILSVVAAGISGILYLTMLFDNVEIDWALVWSELGELMQRLNISDLGYVVCLLELFVLTLLAMLGANLVVYSAISIGHSVNDKRVFKSILAFIGLYIASEIINLTAFRIGNEVLGVNMNTVQSTMVLFGLLIVFEALYCTAYFLITRYFLKNKLNLQ